SNAVRVDVPERGAARARDLVPVQNQMYIAGHNVNPILRATDQIVDQLVGARCADHRAASGHRYWISRPSLNCEKKRHSGQHRRGNPLQIALVFLYEVTQESHGCPFLVADGGLRFGSEKYVYHVT